MAADNKDEKTESGLESYLIPPTPPKAPSSNKADKAGKGLFTGLRVSLMPEELQGKASASLRRLLLIAGLVLVVESAIIGTVWYLVKSYSDKQAFKLDSLVTQVKKIQEENSKLEVTAAGAASFGPQIIASQAALNERTAWSPLFRYLEDITLPTVQYLSFRADTDNNVLYVTCVGKSYRDAAEQITLYQNSEMIEEARVSAVSATVGEEGEFLGVGFSANLTMKGAVWEASQLFDEQGNPVVEEAVVDDEDAGALRIPVREEDVVEDAVAEGDNL